MMQSVEFCDLGALVPYDMISVMCSYGNLFDLAIVLEIESVESYSSVTRQATARDVVVISFNEGVFRVQRTVLLSTDLIRLLSHPVDR